ncbi:MAG: beta-ketoacyl-ACP synthase III [Candidatus Pelagadaptatus aseana]|uniref:beta-ketoacyl-ACP synthase III n=1 Tax=Candidatus Pelagadaptatus aseana TaxID=3120508 RepID=UPI0039B303E6
MSAANVVISGLGLWTPEHSISNEELVESYNAYAEKYNAENATSIEAGDLTAKPLSTAAFIEKASGIKSRYVYIKDGILDPDRMMPNIPLRAEDELSNQAEIAVIAARKAMAAAKKEGKDIDAVIVSCAYTQRYYPAIAIEVQKELGIEGFGFDMLVACSAATFGLQRAYEMVTAGTAKCVLCINPELTSPGNNFRDRDSHFIFGDVATATIVESAETCQGEHSYDILGTKTVTTFSNNIRANIGYMVNVNQDNPYAEHNFFHQQGRKVFKEVCPMAAKHISDHLEETGVANTNVKRWFLHQANINMNVLIAKKLLGRDPEPGEAPIVLDTYANTASAGSLIALNLHHEDMVAGDHSVVCSFGAGYSIGSLVLRKR